MSTKFGYNMTSNKLDMAKVHVFFEWPSYCKKLLTFTKKLHLPWDHYTPLLRLVCRMVYVSVNSYIELSSLLQETLIAKYNYHYYLILYKFPFYKVFFNLNIILKAEVNPTGQ
jgi:hypothetical protein